MKKAVAESLEIQEVDIDGFEKILLVTDPQHKLKGIICIHNTTLGPALGGIRIYPYPHFDAALNDAMRLARGMTYKAAMAEVGLGGGKSVIIASQEEKTPEMLTSFAAAIDQLKGLYTCAEDAGCSMADVTLIGQHTPYVVGTAHPQGSGNPSPFTAWGTLRGIEAVIQTLDRSTSLVGKKIAIQGLGSVGIPLVELLFWRGAELVIADIDEAKAVAVAKKYGAKVCSPQEILQEECDILSPCAMGGIVNEQSIPQLRCRGIAGCANNQLLNDQDAEKLHARGILYAPDFVINAGGLINVSLEIELAGYQPKVARNKTDQIYELLLRLFEIGRRDGCSTHQAALALAEYRLKYRIGKRECKPYYHHFKSQK